MISISAGGDSASRDSRGFDGERALGQWRIVVENDGSVPLATSTQNATTIWVDYTVPVNDPPSAVRSLSIDGGQIHNSDRTPRITWSDATDDGSISRYEWRVDNGSWNSVSNTWGGESVTLPSLADGSHRVDVRAVDDQSQAGPISSLSFSVDTYAPTRPVLTGPSNDRDLSDTTPNFAWAFSTDTGSGIDTYELRIADDSYWTSDIVYKTPSTSFTLPDALDIGEYTWTVTASDNTGKTTTSTSRSFSIVDGADPDPVSNLRSDGGTGWDDDRTPTIRWDEPDDNVGVEDYLWRVNGGSWTVQDEDYVSGESTTLSALSDGVHSFEIRARDAAGNLGDTRSLSLRIDANGPATPTLDAVGTNGRTDDTTPTLSWDAVTDVGSGLAGYEVRVDGPGIADIPTTYTVGASTTRFTIPNSDAMAYGTGSWRVTAIDRAGNETRSTEAQFTIVDGADPDPVSNLRSDGGTGWDDDRTPTISWDEPDDNVGVEDYRWRVDRGSWTVQDEDGFSGESTTLSALSDGVHSFEIQARDAAGNLGDIRSLSMRIDANGPATPTLDAVGANGRTDDTTPTLSWDAVTDAGSGLDEYEVRVDGPGIADIPTTYTVGGQHHALHDPEFRCHGLWYGVLARDRHRPRRGTRPAPPRRSSPSSTARTRIR